MKGLTKKTFEIIDKYIKISLAFRLALLTLAVRCHLYRKVSKTPPRRIFKCASAPDEFVTECEESLDDFQILLSNTIIAELSDFTWKAPKNAFTLPADE